MFKPDTAGSSDSHWTRSCTSVRIRYIVSIGTCSKTGKIDLFLCMDLYHLKHLLKLIVWSTVTWTLITTEQVATSAAARWLVTEQKELQFIRIRLHCKYKNLQQDRWMNLFLCMERCHLMQLQKQHHLIHAITCYVLNNWTSSNKCRRFVDCNCTSCCATICISHRQCDTSCNYSPVIGPVPEWGSTTGYTYWSGTIRTTINRVTLEKASCMIWKCCQLRDSHWTWKLYIHSRQIRCKYIEPAARPVNEPVP